jgi:hypothetical protein
LVTATSGFYHENEWSESGDLMETAEQKEGILGGILRNALRQAA